MKDQGVDGTMGSKWTLGRLVEGGVEWIHLAQDRDRWRAVVGAVMNLRVVAPRSQLNLFNTTKIPAPRLLARSAYKAVLSL
jgi:hypothetical protein